MSPYSVIITSHIPVPRPVKPRSVKTRPVYSNIFIMKIKNTLECWIILHPWRVVVPPSGKTPFSIPDSSTTVIMIESWIQIIISFLYTLHCTIILTKHNVHSNFKKHIQKPVTANRKKYVSKFYNFLNSTCTWKLKLRCNHETP